MDWLGSLRLGLVHMEWLGLFHEELWDQFYPQWLGLFYAEIVLLLPDSLYLPSTVDIYRVGLNGLPEVMDI